MLTYNIHKKQTDQRMCREDTFRVRRRVEHYTSTVSACVYISIGFGTGLRMCRIVEPLSDGLNGACEP